LDFALEHKLVNDSKEVVLYIKEKILLNDLQKIKRSILDEFKNKTQFYQYDNLKNMFKIAVRYDPEFLKLKKEDINKDFDYLFLGPDFLVSSNQPALGMVYKIMEMNSLPCIKFSEDKDKQTIPGSKSIYRLYDSNNNLIGDYLTLVSEKDDFIKEKNIKAL